MPKIQVVISDDLSQTQAVIHYIGYDRKVAREVFTSLLGKPNKMARWVETDEDTKIDLKIGREEF